MKLSPHFSLAEFRCKSGHYPPAEAPHPWVPGARCWPLESLIELCVRVLEPIRAHVGPIRIVSGYRDPAYNEAIRMRGIQRNGRTGVAKRSQHLLGKAADIAIAGDDNSVERLELITRELMATTRMPVGYIAAYTRWLHVDTRERKTSQ